ncbi:MAG: acyloxyacyl hydrolase [Bacteroidota bacterium]
MLNRNANYHKIFGLLFILISVATTSTGQQGFSASYDYGQIIVHAPDIEPLKKGPVRGFTLNYAFPNKNGEEWRKFYNYSNYGICYNFNNYSNKEQIGNSHSINLFGQFPFLKKRSVFDIGFKSFAGVGYFEKIYDEDNNPDNHASSSHFNISAEVGFYSRIRIAPVYFEYSIGINHLSNGLTNYPNRGLNNFKNRFALGVELEKQVKVNKVPKEEKPLFVKNDIWLYGAGGVKEIEGYDRKYGVFITSLNFSKQITTINKLGIGIDFVNDQSLTDKARYKYGYMGNSNINFRFGPNVQAEFLFGRLSFVGAYGFYFGDNTYYTRKRYYKAGFKYDFGKLIAIGILRAMPLFKASVVEFGIGYSIKSYN